MEKEMATHSRFLALKIPWTEEFSMLPSMGSQRVGHDLMTKQQQQMAQSEGIQKDIPHITNHHGNENQVHSVI